MSTSRSFPFVRVATLAALLVLPACGDDPVGVEDEHAEPAQVEIAFGDVVVARAFVGSATGFIGTQLNEETPTLTVTFLDGENALVVPDEDEYLEVVVADETIAVWESTSPGSFSGTVSGLAVGETTATFRYMHGAVGSGHADFVAHPINVIIN